MLFIPGFSQLHIEIVFFHQVAKSWARWFHLFWVRVRMIKKSSFWGLVSSHSVAFQRIALSWMKLAQRGQHSVSIILCHIRLDTYVTKRTFWPLIIIAHYYISPIICCNGTSATQRKRITRNQLYKFYLFQTANVRFVAGNANRGRTFRVFKKFMEDNKRFDLIFKTAFFRFKLPKGALSAGNEIGKLEWFAR